jgi:hypothetical protein
VSCHERDVHGATCDGWNFPGSDILGRGRFRQLGEKLSKGEIYFKWRDLLVGNIIRKLETTKERDLHSDCQYDKL